MSVIFNALKRLEFKSAAEKKKSNKLIKGRHIYSLRRMLFSPVSCLCLAFSFFLSALVVCMVFVNSRDVLKKIARNQLYPAVLSRNLNPIILIKSLVGL